MYFTELPSLNSIEAIMKQPPGANRRGGGRKRSSHKYNKKDCDCRFCLEHSKDGCTADICPVLDIRLSCGAASFRESVQAIFAGARHIPFQKRLSKIYDRKDDKPVVFQNEQHQRIFEAQRKNLRKPDNQALAVLYLLTADHDLWFRMRLYIDGSGKVDLQAGRLEDISIDGYAIWKAVKELQTGEKQISLSELSDRDVISDRAFRFIVQAVAIARLGIGILREWRNRE